MARILFLVLLVFLLRQNTLSSQNYYFPPLVGNEWSTTSPEALGWCTDKIPALYEYLESEETKAFIVLKDGKIVLEKYFGTFTVDSNWYWASAGKTLTSFMVGIAQEQGKLSIQDRSNLYLGRGWTSLAESQEDKITIRHHLTMTTGLDDGVPDNFCTDPAYLIFKADPGTRWAYHNAPYTLLDEVIKGATNQNLNNFIFNNLSVKTGISGLFIKQGYNNVFFSKPRSMARFGSLMLNAGSWNGTKVMTDTSYLRASIQTSQDINPSYGYLWWLNGKERSMVPQSQIVFNRPLFTEAPSDMYSALGKNGQILNIVPSQNLIMIRMGNNANNLPVPFLLNDEIWKRFNEVNCTTSTKDENKSDAYVDVFPNPANEFISITAKSSLTALHLVDAYGNFITDIDSFALGETKRVDVSGLPTGWYWLTFVVPSGEKGASAVFVFNGN